MEIIREEHSYGTIKDLPNGCPFYLVGRDILYMKVCPGSTLMKGLVKACFDDSFCVNLETGEILMVEGNRRVIPATEFACVELERARNGNCKK